MKYKEVNLGELVSFVSKGIPPKYIETKSDNTIVVLNQRTNRNFQIDYSLSRLNDLSKKKVPTNKILIDYDVLINSTGVGTAGRVAQLVKVPELTTVDGHMIIVRPDEEKIDPLYLGYALKAQQVKIEGLQEGSTGQTELNRQRLLNDIIIQFPESRKLQQDISRLFFSLDEKIENNKKINHHLEQMAQVLFEQVYYDGSSAQLGDALSTLESGSRPKGGAELDGIPSIGAENIERFGQYDYTKEKFISHEYFKRLNRGVVHSGDVLLYKDGAYTGKVSMALDGFPHAQCAVNEHIFILRPNELAPSSFFLYFLLLNSENKQALFSRASSKAAQPGLNQTEVKTLPILLPKIEKIVEFDNTIAPFMHQIAKNANENRKLSTLRDTLLPKLLSGEISVN
ncbi:restriction endonuclease subunit S [Streptococcus mutans]|uniref:restriction endonuclease subunit S n=3 Tax=Streptococcus mutans TaxID=1309 RepID=UPI0004636286|nr:restriction endonuclease subunit S [Streptococcus mutans]